jgi:Malonyl-CoA decarboxylase N-terminal domain
MLKRMPGRVISAGFTGVMMCLLGVPLPPICCVATDDTGRMPQQSTDVWAQLAQAAEPTRQELLRRMNMARGGTAALVAMRKDLLSNLRSEPGLKPLDSDLRHLLGSWFNRGFLELRE